MDQFIDIAKTEMRRSESVVETKQEICESKLLLAPSSQKYVFPEEISTREELNELLCAARQKYSGFLNDFHPIEKTGIKSTELTDFEVDGKRISLPDYGGPTGNCEKTYYCEFTLDKKQNKHYRILFKAVDYIAFVYINGECVGTHEGFFSPFKFDVTNYVKNGKNSLKVVVKNDYTYLGKDHDGSKITVEGDKLYACTGLGWDDPYSGWHHCPPGFGMYGKVYIEECDDIIIDDIFVRTASDYSSELWVEVYNFTYKPVKPEIRFDIYGCNFDATEISGREYGFEENVYIKHGYNVFKTSFKIKNPRLWTNETPWLYKVAVSLGGAGVQISERKFGVRTFVQDTESDIKGAFYLNGKKIRLRGANTMGFEQQDVLRGDFEQLKDDILLAKLCNMNFWRITQRPVQEEIYDYCDMLGLMVQTDLPLFGVMRRNKFAEGVRQAEEMERLVRSHPCVILDTFINEPFKNGREEPHRHMTREELLPFFDACKSIIWLNNPDRVIKSVDGDYDPPCDDMPDFHCYNMWYNNHAILFGKFNKGYRAAIKPGWYYGCGEFGTEGLDSVDLMKRRYPPEWIKEPFSPDNILRAQTGVNYGVFYAKPQSENEWVERSREYQAYATKTMTEYFRRDRLNVSFALHLFIDAWPAGWMKAVMDCERNPKPAFFAYRNALKKVITSFRTDRCAYFCGEEIKIESYLCNDTSAPIKGKIVYAVENSRGETVFSKEVEVGCNECDSVYLHSAAFTVAEVDGREKFKLRSHYSDGENESVNEIEIEVFAPIEYKKNDKLKIIELKTCGETEVCGEKVRVFDMYAGGIYYVETPKNEIFDGILERDDLHFLYNEKTDMINFTADNAFTSEGFVPLIVKPSYSGADFGREELLSYKRVGDEVIVITTINILKENPAVNLLLKALNERLK